MSCEENTRLLAANGQEENVGIPFDSDLIKCCPMCSVPIEKDEGCAQMMCKRCKHVFCWYCLASLDVSVALNYIWCLEKSINLSRDNKFIWFRRHFRTIFCCATMTKDRAKINWVIHVRRSFGIVPKLLVYLPVSVFYFLSHRHCCCWPHRASFAVSVVFATVPQSSKKPKPNSTKRSHCIGRCPRRKQNKIENDNKNGNIFLPNR